MSKKWSINKNYVYSGTKIQKCIRCQKTYIKKKPLKLARNIQKGQQQPSGWFKKRDGSLDVFFLWLWGIIIFFMDFPHVRVPYGTNQRTKVPSLFIGSNTQQVVLYCFLDCLHWLPWLTIKTNLSSIFVRPGMFPMSASRWWWVGLTLVI